MLRELERVAHELLRVRVRAGARARVRARVMDFRVRVISVRVRIRFRARVRARDRVRVRPWAPRSDDTRSLPAPPLLSPALPLEGSGSARTPQASAARSSA